VKSELIKTQHGLSHSLLSGLEMIQIEFKIKDFQKPGQEWL